MAVMRDAVRYEPDAADRILMNVIQGDFPLVSEPFAAIGEAAGLPAEEAMDRIRRLKETRIIRQISAIFDSRNLGYSSSLVAMQFPKERVDAEAEVISKHPGVSHNYRRNHPYNLWFTIAVPPGRSLEADVSRLTELTRPDRMWLLPTIRLFKIGVNLDMNSEAEITRKESGAGYSWKIAPQVVPLTEGDIRAIRELQKDIPIIPRPFEVMSERMGASESQLLEIAKRFLERGQMRRFSAVLHHREAGYVANAMGVWAVPEERIEEIGLKMASYTAVSHCYHRPTYPDWPYSIFTMIHARSAPECHTVAEVMSQETGIGEYDLLFSTKEYKKTRVKYFIEGEFEEFDALKPA
ncbi:MAG: Lrp/AsnC family transcriptional regulator [Armatimonadetes bacterium]|nr:Lrp/AsnC family transcriptional regulator [Armatimonadota bacterium]